MSDDENLIYVLLSWV